MSSFRARYRPFVHACAKLTLASATLCVVTLVARSGRAAAQANDSQQAAPADSPTAPSGVRLFIDPNVTFGVELERLLVARLQSAGFSVTNGRPAELETHPQVLDGAAQEWASDRALSNLSEAAVALAVLVRVEGTTCTVGLIDVARRAESVRELPLPPRNHGTLVEEVVTVVLSSGSGVRTLSNEPPNAATASPSAAEVGPPKKTTKISESASESIDRANAPDSVEAKPAPEVSPVFDEPSPVRVVVRAGVHAQSINSTEASFGPRLHLALGLSEHSDWFVLAWASYHPAKSITTHLGAFDVAHAMFALGPSHEWRLASWLRGSVGAALMLGHVARSETQAVVGVEGTPASSRWRQGAEFGLQLEAGSGELRAGLGLSAGAWNTAVDFASSDGNTVLAEAAIFAAGAVWLGYAFGN